MAITGRELRRRLQAAYMQSAGLTEVYSYGTDFDRIEGIVRVEPE